MSTHSPNLVSSGIEPVDELLGGLAGDQLYLLHGEASGKSLFGIKFLIEGLKEGENCAMVIRYSPEDAVQRFARLGYDCLEDVYSGKLVILECSDDIIQRIGSLRELTPVLRELEWLLGETRPSRLIFDPVTSIVAGAGGNIEPRAGEFSEWARSFGATVILIANGANPEIVSALRPLVAESFRFDVRETGDQAGRYLAFEKSPDIPDALIEVDPSRGVFLLRPVDVRPLTHPLPSEIQSIREELRSTLERIRQDELEPLEDIDLSQPEPIAVPSQQPSKTPRTTRLTPSEKEAVETPVSVPAPPESTIELELEEPLAPTGEPGSAGVSPASLRIEPASEQAGETPALPGLDDLSHLLDDLTGSASPLDLDIPELEAPPAQEKRERASDLLIDSARAERVAEMLLTPPESPPAAPSRKARPLQPSHETPVTTKDFNVLVVLDDAETCDQVTRQLADYAVEIVHDGVSALAKLISFEPDLVILDFDLPVVDGFKLLTLIRASLDVPIIVVTASRLRAVDRVMASELGADYYLTKPFSAKELKYKARQLIARYRGLDSWIVSSNTPPKAPPSVRREAFVPYAEFAEEVEKRVKAAIDEVAPFSIVGCRLPGMTSDAGRLASRLYDTAREFLRESDLISTNPRNELVILLSDASEPGARAFATRLGTRIRRELNQEPILWVRTFPNFDESIESPEAVFNSAAGVGLGRRFTDTSTEARFA